jgi:hypothetical protein
MPSLQGSSGHLKPLGGLTLGDTLSLQVKILLEQIGPLETVPELVTVEMAVEIVAGWKIDYSAHGYLLLQPVPGGKMMMAKNGEVAL